MLDKFTTLSIFNFKILDDEAEKTLIGEELNAYRINRALVDKLMNSGDATLTEEEHSRIDEIIFYFFFKSLSS